MKRQAESLRNRIVAEWAPEVIYSSSVGRCQHSINETGHTLRC